MHIRPIFLLLACLTALGGNLWSQLDLPRAPRAKVAKPKSVELPSNPTRHSLLQEAFGDQSPVSKASGAELDNPGARRRSAAVLDLPRGRPSSEAGATEPQVAPDSPEATVSALFERMVRQSLRKEIHVRLFAELCDLGEPALALAREQLPGTSKRRALLAGRLLLEAGGAAGRALVREHLRAKLPASVGTQLLRDLAQRDPLLTDPAYLMDLLEHPVNSMRETADELARERMDESWLPRFVAAAGSASSSLRLHAVSLASDLKGPAARRLMLSVLADKRTAIAMLAAEALAHWEGADTILLLRSLVFERGVWDRSAGYGLLALIQRERNLKLTLLNTQDIPWLLKGLDHRLPLVAGAAAAALAGIGFRADESLEAEWLRQRVPDTLVRFCTGYVFHKDLQALQEVGLQRLGLISGEPWSTRGSAWQAWWAEHAEGFRPRRSALAPGPNAELYLRVSLVGREAHQSVQLRGPGLAPPLQEHTGRVYFLSHSQALGLMASIQAHGLFGASRLPGSYGALGPNNRILRVAVQAGEKVFESSSIPELDWFGAVATHVQNLAQTLLWQDWYDRSRYASRFDFYAAEGPWWEQAEARVARLRLKALMLDRIAAQEPEERTHGLAELARQVGDHGLLERADFAPLMGLLRAESDYGTRFSIEASSRARAIVALLMQAARTPRGGLGAELAEVLALHLAESFGDRARLDLEQLLDQAGGDLLWRFAQGSDPVLRLSSARALALRAKANTGQGALRSPSGLELLFELLGDDEPRVATAALEVVAELGLPACKPHVLLRARAHRDNPVEVRAAALRALGKLGGPDVRELCVLALGESRPELVKAAVEGLASTADPRNAALLVSLLESGPGSGYFGAASEGLRLLGSQAAPELMPLALSESAPVRRQAGLLLAAAGVPEAASQLLMLLTEDPEDQRVAEELAILSAIDLRQSQSPVSAWWGWWDGVVHDDPGGWFLAALAREGLDTGPTGAQAGEEASVGLEDLLGWAHVKEPILRERLRRELSRLLGRSIDPIPFDPASLAAWKEHLRTLAAGKRGD